MNPNLLIRLSAMPPSDAGGYAPPLPGSRQDVGDPAPEPKTMSRQEVDALLGKAPPAPAAPQPPATPLIPPVGPAQVIPTPVPAAPPVGPTLAQPAPAPAVQPPQPAPEGFIQVPLPGGATQTISNARALEMIGESIRAEATLNEAKNLREQLRPLQALQVWAEGDPQTRIPQLQALINGQATPPAPGGMPAPVGAAAGDELGMFINTPPPAPWGTPDPVTAALEARLRALERGQEENNARRMEATEATRVQDNAAQAVSEMDQFAIFLNNPQQKAIGEHFIRQAIGDPNNYGKDPRIITREVAGVLETNSRNAAAINAERHRMQSTLAGGASQLTPPAMQTPSIHAGLTGASLRDGSMRARISQVLLASNLDQG